ncbi:MAG: short-chain dehydrogenase [Rhodospirillaceae bacterium]|nr:short-chain dehydrogenase [Rhodospirillaceae bacterium]|tara:strand:- start:1294 stop:2112 length:819 start_codon:yes stop_codon:yes gene_type:complete
MIDSLDLGLKGKVGIVAGGGAKGDGIGNGRAAAILLAEAGVKVVVADRELDLADNTVKMIENRGGKGISIGADLTSSEECKKVVDLAMETWGRLDILDNNIGIASKLSVVDETEENWDKVMDINLKPMFLLSKHAIPAMIASGDGGSIVNISSISATRPKGLTVYSTSKGAVLSLSQAMAVDHGADGIRVNCILPGPVYTPMVYSPSSYLREEGMSSEQRQQRQNASLVQIEGEGWDIGKAVVYLSSNWARYITGHLMVVDGGCSLSAKTRG